MTTHYRARRLLSPLPLLLAILFSPSIRAGERDYSGAYAHPNVPAFSLAANPAPTLIRANQIALSDAFAFTGGVTQSSAGTFTNTQSQFYLQSLLNSCNPTTEFHFSQGNTNNTTDGLTGCLTMPNGATVHQGNAVAGYVNTSCNSASRTVCNAVGGYFWGRAITSNSAVWGINGIVNDTPATTGTNVQASELDIGIAGTPSFVCGQCLNLSGTGLGTGTMPVNSFGFSISAANALQFNFGYNSSRGATTNAGLFLDGQNTTNNTFSQSIELAGYDSGGTQHVASINATPTGSVNLTPAAGQYAILPAGTGTELIEGTAPSGVATTDICYGDSTAHAVKCSYNNDTFSPLARQSAFTLTLKKGSGGGNYTNATTSYTVADSTNLCYTVTIPTGWKLGVSMSGNLGTATAAVVANYALTDNAACSTANAGILVEGTVTGTGATVLEPIALNWVITGDGAAHNIALQFKTSNGADSATLQNSSATLVPTMKFELMPSN